MDNPCKECIVNAMCKKSCESLERYIEYYLESHDGIAPGPHTIYQVARSLRLGNIILKDNCHWGYDYIK